jgi:hypothetical protein
MTGDTESAVAGPQQLSAAQQQYQSIAKRLAREAKDQCPGKKITSVKFVKVNTPQDVVPGEVIQLAGAVPGMDLMVEIPEGAVEGAQFEVPYVLFEDEVVVGNPFFLKKETRPVTPEESIHDLINRYAPSPLSKYSDDGPATSSIQPDIDVDRENESVLDLVDRYKALPMNTMEDARPSSAGSSAMVPVAPPRHPKAQKQKKASSEGKKDRKMNKDELRRYRELLSQGKVLDAQAYRRKIVKRGVVWKQKADHYEAPSAEELMQRRQQKAEEHKKTKFPMIEPRLRKQPVLTVPMAPALCTNARKRAVVVPNDVDVDYAVRQANRPRHIPALAKAREPETEDAIVAQLQEVQKAIQRNKMEIDCIERQEQAKKLALDKATVEAEEQAVVEAGARVRQEAERRKDREKKQKAQENARKQAGKMKRETESKVKRAEEQALRKAAEKRVRREEKQRLKREAVKRSLIKLSLPLWLDFLPASDNAAVALTCRGWHGAWREEQTVIHEEASIMLQAAVRRRKAQKVTSLKRFLRTEHAIRKIQGCWKHRKHRIGAKAYYQSLLQKPRPSNMGTEAYQARSKVGASGVGGGIGMDSGDGGDKLDDFDKWQAELDTRGVVEEMEEMETGSELAIPNGWRPGLDDEDVGGGGYESHTRLDPPPAAAAAAAPAAAAPPASASSAAPAPAPAAAAASAAASASACAPCALSSTSADPCKKHMLVRCFICNPR